MALDRAGHAVEVVVQAGEQRDRGRAARTGPVKPRRSQYQIAAATVSPLPRVIWPVEDALAGAVADVGVEQIDRDPPVEVDLEQQARTRGSRSSICARSSLAKPPGRSEDQVVPWILPSLKVIGRAT